jgi:hypothetical protein
MRTRREQVAALEERARRLEREREEQSRRAVSEERLRIARELHDVVAHSMSVIAVQAGVANHVIDSRPDLARDALSTVETNSRAALVEMRRLLGVLRQGDEPSASLAPTPGLSEVPALVRRLARAGLDVAVSVEGSPSGVPDAVDLSGYRIVQEGLTNVLRHGGPAARVTIGYRRGALDLSVVDDGRPPGAARVEPASGAGQGLIGMRERVAVFGGRFTAGPRPDGGFAVTATLPYAEAPGRSSAAVAAANGAAPGTSATVAPAPGTGGPVARAPGARGSGAPAPGAPAPGAPGVDAPGAGATTNGADAPGIAAPGTPAPYTPGSGTSATSTPATSTPAPGKRPPGAAAGGTA